MRILYVADIRLPTEKAHGGAIMRMCQALSAAGAEVELVVPTRRNYLSVEPFAYYHMKPTFRITRLHAPDTTLWGKLGFAFHAVMFGRAVRRYARRVQPDALYGRDPLVLSALLSCKTPVYFESHQAYTTRAVRRIATRARGIICISAALAAHWRTLGARAERLLVAPSGVDLSVFDTPTDRAAARRTLGLPLAAPLAVYTGNFTTMGMDKGISDTLRALRAVPDARFVAVGGSEPDRMRYAEEARSLWVAGRVQLVGHASQAELALYQKAADMLLMPFPDTPHYRGVMSPIKMFEYMAAERPIIATDLPTIREVLSEKNAIIIPPGDPRALAGAIQEVSAYPGQYLSRASAAHADAMRYSWEARAARILDFIKFAHA